RPLAALSMTTPEEQLLLSAWNDTGDEPRPRSVPHLFAEQVRARPDAVAVVTATGTLTYAELDRQANRLAHRLIGLGLRPEEPVGLALGHAAAVVAELAVLKAGGAYLPLDLRAPAERQ